MGASPHEALGRRKLTGDMRLLKLDPAEHGPPHSSILPQMGEKGKWQPFRPSNSQYGSMV
jgi:hypothetical protein